MITRRQIIGSFLAVGTALLASGGAHAESSTSRSLSVPATSQANDLEAQRLKACWFDDNACAPKQQPLTEQQKREMQKLKDCFRDDKLCDQPAPPSNAADAQRQRVLKTWRSPEN